MLGLARGPVRRGQDLALVRRPSLLLDCMWWMGDHRLK